MATAAFWIATGAVHALLIALVAVAWFVLADDNCAGECLWLVEFLQVTSHVLAQKLQFATTDALGAVALFVLRFVALDAALLAPLFSSGGKAVCVPGAENAAAS